MSAVVFDFPRYVALRKGVIEQREREGATYAYGGARKLQRALVSTRPVTLALEAALRLWTGSARKRLLAQCQRVSEDHDPIAYDALRSAASVLGLAVPPLYLAPDELGLRAHALGTEEDPLLVVTQSVRARLSESELIGLMGYLCGAVQNNHVPYATALHYLSHSAHHFVRWTVKPAAMALKAWSRRAQITCDRAALLCTRDLNSAFTALVKLEVELPAEQVLDIDDYLRDAPERSRIGELFRAHPYLPKRARALQLFAESMFYRRHNGDTTGQGKLAEQVDQEVSAILSVFR